MPRDVRTSGAYVVRSRAYAFVLDARGMPIEIGSGRFAKAYLGEERWLESKTDFRREVVIKVLQKGVTEEDRMRFQIEKELLERVQGHPNIITLFASGESDDPDFVPPSIREKIENDFVILERLDMSLEERLKGTRVRGKRDDLLACDMRERLFRVLDYMIPVASAIEYAHLVNNICHRDIKPANILLGLPDPNLRGSTLAVRLADFNVAKLTDEDVSFGMTKLKGVPGTLFFQSPEQETNVIELLVNVQQGSPEVEFFEDFYIQIEKNDSFSLFNRNEQYMILYADRAKKRIVLDRPFDEPSETNVRAKIQKSVGRPADIYSLGVIFYYLISGAYANPKTLYDAFHKFIEYEHPDENNTIEGYLTHEYSVIESLRRAQVTRTGRERRAGGSLLLVQALPRRQRRAHRPQRHEDHRQVHDPEQAGQLLPGERRGDPRHPGSGARPRRPVFNLWLPPEHGLHPVLTPHAGERGTAGPNRSCPRAPRQQDPWRLARLLRNLPAQKAVAASPVVPSLPRTGSRRSGGAETRWDLEWIERGRDGSSPLPCWSAWPRSVLEWPLPRLRSDRRWRSRRSQSRSNPRSSSSTVPMSSSSRRPTIKRTLA